MLMIRSRLPNRRLALPLAAGLALVGLSVALAQGLFGDVAEHFRQGRYDVARETLATAAASQGEPGEARLWQQRLATDPAAAHDLALQIVRDRGVPFPRRVQAGLDGAAAALAGSRPEAAWLLLQPLLDQSDATLPGEVHLLAGQALRMAGDRQRAREMLASVRPEDPAFAAARSLLGRIGLESGDHELALRYFESAERRLGAGERPELLAERWQALRLLGRDLEARDAAEALLRDHPTSLAALELSELLRREEQELASAAGDDEPVTADAADDAVRPVDGGRFTIQLAAFRDRALALQFLSRWRREIPELRMIQHQDELDQPLHRVQVGAFVSRQQAATELDRLRRQHGLEGFVTESGE
jgi:tetratricopeptide (TPR) repeat protein